LVNDRLEEATDELRAIVLSERLRRSGETPSEEDQKKIRMAEGNRLSNARARIQGILDSFRGEMGPGSLVPETIG